MKKFLLFIMLFQLLLTGCMEKEILDDVNLVTAGAFDIIDNGQLRGVANINTYLKDQPVEDQLLSQEAELSRDILSDMQKQSTNPLVLGKLQIVLFGESVAKSGVNELVDTLQRDATISERLLLVVTRGEAKGILESDFSPQGASEFLTNLVLHNKNHLDVPKLNLHMFLYQYYSKGQDAYLPILKRKDNIVEIDGLALFDQDKVVGEISNERMFFFKTLADNYTKGSYTLALPASEEKVGIMSISSSRKLKLLSTEPLKVEISIHLKGFINEYTGEKITLKITKEAEREFEEVIKREALAMIGQFKALKIDPIGIGDEIRSKSRSFSMDEWEDKISELDVEVKANVVISETGVVH